MLNSCEDDLEEVHIRFIRITETPLARQHKLGKKPLISLGGRQKNSLKKKKLVFYSQKDQSL